MLATIVSGDNLVAIDIHYLSMITVYKYWVISHVEESFQNFMHCLETDALLRSSHSNDMMRDAIGGKPSLELWTFLIG